MPYNGQPLTALKYMGQDLIVAGGGVVGGKRS